MDTHTHTHTHTENRKGILEETEEVNAPATNAGKTLWWDQAFISKDEMKEIKSFWDK